MSIKTVLFGFLGCGGLATLAFLWTRFSGKGSLEKVHGIFQKKKQEAISKIEADQENLKVSLDKKEDLAEDTTPGRRSRRFRRMLPSPSQRC